MGLATLSVRVDSIGQTFQEWVGMVRIPLSGGISQTLCRSEMDKKNLVPFIPLLSVVIQEDQNGNYNKAGSLSSYVAMLFN